jgi:hypothetical protein
MMFIYLIPDMFRPQEIIIKSVLLTILFYSYQQDANKCMRNLPPKR